MKSYHNNFTFKQLCLSLVLFILISNISSLRNRKEKYANAKIKNENKLEGHLFTEFETERKAKSSKVKSSSHIKRFISSNIESSIASRKNKNKNNITNLSASNFQQLNKTLLQESSRQQVAQFVAKNRNWDFKLLDKQLEDIAIDMTFQKEYGSSPGAIRSFTKYFISYFENCDTDYDNMLSKIEFRQCLKNDTFLSKIDIPNPKYAALNTKQVNATNADSYSDFLFELLDSHRNSKLNFYEYMVLRLLTFSWTRCSVGAPFIEESNFQCAIEIAAGWKTMHRNKVRRLFYLALELSGSESTRNLDFLSFAQISLSARLFGKINNKEDNQITRNELQVSLDNNILPIRYNQEIINQIFKLIEEADRANQGLDLISFSFYDFWLKIFDVKNPAKKYYQNLENFLTAVESPMFPRHIKEAIEKIPQNNLTYNSYKMYTYLNISNYLDESDHFLKSFIEKKSLSLSDKSENIFNDQWSIKEATKNTIKYKFNLEKTYSNIFNTIDNQFDGFISFYDFGTFVQITYISLKSTSLIKEEFLLVN